MPALPTRLRPRPAAVFALFAAVGALVLACQRRAPLSLLPLPPPPRLTLSLNPFSVPTRVLPPAQLLPPHTLRILVLGDSVASFLGLALRYRQEEEGVFVAERGVGSCSIFASAPYVNEAGATVLSHSCSTTWVDDVRELRPDLTLVLMGGAFLRENACDAAWLTLYQERVLALSRDMGADAGRVVLTLVPYPLGRWRHGAVLEQADCFNAMLEKTAPLAKLATLNLAGYLCPTRDCEGEGQGPPPRPDGLHFDGKGAEDIARFVLRELKRVSDIEALPSARTSQ